MRSDAAKPSRRRPSCFSSAPKFSMDIHIYNTLTAKKEPFQPVMNPEVRMYVCGITPYDSPHLGHARCYVVFDVIKRVLTSQGFKVRHVQNFTDVDDKVIARAAEKK